jgi:hypothetical protein
MLTVRAGSSKWPLLCGILALAVSSEAVAARDAQNSFKLDWATKMTGVVSKTIPVNYTVTNAAKASPGCFDDGA